jgi:hypothetical protein
MSEVPPYSLDTKRRIRTVNANPDPPGKEGFNVRPKGLEPDPVLITGCHSRLDKGVS